MSGFEFIPGESFNGAVARWADEVGGIERMIDLTRVAGVRYGHLQRASSADADDIRALANEMGVDVDELLTRSVPATREDRTNNQRPVDFAGVVIPSLLIEKRIRRFSPTALASSPHHRALWDVRLLPACTVTGEILLDRCGDPECRRTGWTATLGIDRCEHCMADLRQLEAARIPEETRVILSEFAGLFSHDAAVRVATLALLPPEIAALGPSDVVDLVMRIAPVVDNGLPIDVASLLNAEPERLCAAVASSWRAIVHWPAGIADVAAERIATRVGRHNDGNGGRTMRLLARRRQVGASDAVLDVLDGWRRSITIDDAGGAALFERTVTGSAVARTTGLDVNTVVGLRRAGLFRVHFAIDFQRPEARYDRAEIEAIDTALREHRSHSVVRRELGISAHGVEQLMAMGLLDGLDNAFLDVRHGERQVRGASVDALTAALRTTAQPFPECTTFVSLRSAMKVIGGRLKPWGPAFRMLLSGEIPFAFASGDLPVSDAIRVDAATAQLLRSVHLPHEVAARMSDRMSKMDAGELLNLNATRTTRLLADVKTGIGSHEKAVPLDMVLRLARRHITASEMGARLGVPWRTACKSAAIAGVPLLGDGGFCRAKAETLLL